MQGEKGCGDDDGGGQAKGAPAAATCIPLPTVVLICVCVVIMTGLVMSWSQNAGEQQRRLRSVCTRQPSCRCDECARMHHHYS